MSQKMYKTERFLRTSKIKSSTTMTESKQTSRTENSKKAALQKQQKKQRLKEKMQIIRNARGSFVFDILLS